MKKNYLQQLNVLKVLESGCYVYLLLKDQVKKNSKQIYQQYGNKNMSNKLYIYIFFFFFGVKKDVQRYMFIKKIQNFIFAKKTFIVLL